MCSVCGVLDGPAHWSQAIGRLKLAQTTTARAERARSAALLNKIAATRRAKVSDWQGTQWLVAGPTGAQEVVDSLALVWAALDRIAGRPIDPLSDEWLA
jgi:hypothetical protein